MSNHDQQHAPDSLEDRRKAHSELLKQWESHHKQAKHSGDWHFTMDGPSDWPQYYRQHPRVLFLLKESHGDEWHPSIPCTMDQTRFSENVTLWKYAINMLYRDPTQQMSFPALESIHNGDHADIAFVEAKKLNEGKGTSDDNEIKTYAAKDKEFLKAQIALLAPHIVLCAGTIDAYDAIYEEQYDPYVLLSSNGSCKCWRLSNRLVIEFFHPSYWGKTPQELYSLLCSPIKTGNVFENFPWSKWCSRPPGS